MSGFVTIARMTLQEAVRRRVVAVVSALTLLLGALYVLVAYIAFRDAGSPGAALDAQALAGSTLLGLAMFATLFLGAVLAVFLTLSAVRGDAERGILQPLVVRPLGRRSYLAARFLSASVVCGAYVALVYAGAVVATGVVGGWWPANAVAPALGLIAGVAVLVALSLLGSTLLSSTANGIAAFIVFGGGMTAGLLGQIGDAIDSAALRRIADVATWVLPFEAAYQAGLHALTSGTTGVTQVIVRLGPFGGAHAAGLWLVPWTLLYLVVVGIAADRIFARADL